VVDQIFNNYILLPGKNFPFFAQYDDGIEVNNPGWLSQWGSKNLADQGYNALQILRYYYVTDLTLENAEEIEGLPTSFPGYNLKTGSCGEPVKILPFGLGYYSYQFTGRDITESEKK
jgi:hypothetical protein